MSEDESKKQSEKLVSFVLDSKNYLLLKNLVKLLLIALINNDKIVTSHKLDIIKSLVCIEYDSNNQESYICVEKELSTEKILLSDMSHEIFELYEKNIYSNIFTQAYSFNVPLNKNNFNLLIKVVKLYLEFRKDEINKSIHDHESLSKKIMENDVLELEFNMNLITNPLKIEDSKFYNELLEKNKNNEAIIDQLKRDIIEKDNVIKNKESSILTITKEKEELQLSNNKFLNEERESEDIKRKNLFSGLFENNSQRIYDQNRISLLKAVNPEVDLDDIKSKNQLEEKISKKFIIISILFM